MAFNRYYQSLVRKGDRNTPSADEARRDYQESLRRAVDGMLYGR